MIASLSGSHRLKGFCDQCLGANGIFDLLPHCFRLGVQCGLAIAQKFGINIAFLCGFGIAGNILRRLLICLIRILIRVLRETRGIILAKLDVENVVAALFQVFLNLIGQEHP